MPTIFEEGQYRFIINPREEKFEPPHIHIWIGNDYVCRLELISGNFMNKPPPGESRNILSLYKKHAIEIRKKWDEIHGR
jgi:hypothetical protein